MSYYSQHYIFISKLRITEQATVIVMNNQLSKIAGNSKAFSNKSVNQVLLSFNASRENIAMGKYHIIY